MKKVTFLTPIILGLICSLNIQAIAQKLPNVQKESIPAPAKVSIDGKADEWGTSLNAFNKATSIYYTMANDKNNLYLIIQAQQKDIVHKILAGGVTLQLENTTKSKTSMPFSIKFPVLPGKNQGTIYHVIADTAKLTSDALSSLNQDFETNAKEISVKGSDAISDSLISIYNAYGIKAAGLMDVNKTYTYELALPLKYLSPFIGGNGELNYTIRLNGMKATVVRVVLNGKPVEGGMASAEAMAAMQRIDTGSSRGGGGSIMDLTTPTDLTSVYTLVK